MDKKFVGLPSGPMIEVYGTVENIRRCWPNAIRVYDANYVLLWKKPDPSEVAYRGPMWATSQTIQ
jgi:hypothetical protein